MLANKYISKYFPHYFFQEIKPFLNSEVINKFIGEGPNVKNSEGVEIRKITKEELENFTEKRKVGENEQYLCEIIRKDLLNEFIEYTQRLNISG